MTMRMPWMDVKLGLRVLLRSPGITLVGVFGMAVAIAIAAGAFTMIGRQLNPTLPLADGDRIVSIQAWDAAVNGPDGRILHDFLQWRDELQSVKDVGAFRDVSSNVISQGRAPEPVQVAEMTAAGFRVAAVSPLLGRYLSDEDERPAAPRVLVIGAAVWRDRFGSDPAILGTSVQLNDTHHTIVGIMPDGFAFPVNHGWWVPLRVDAARVAPREGPAINVFARLSDGETIRTAQAELTGVGGRISAASPATHQHIRPRVLPYAHPFSGADSPENALGLRLVRFFLAVLLVVVSVNVAVLVYARTATRQGEIAIRTALGATRSRIVAQLFVEALMLAAIAAAIGLAMVTVGLVQMRNAMGDEAPLAFWERFDVSAGTVLYVFALMLLGAGLIGVLPALKATGPRVQSRLQTLSAGAGAGMQLGRTWTVLIVLQVAFAVALLPWTVVRGWELMRGGTLKPGFASEEVLTARFALNLPLGAPAPTVGQTSEHQVRSADRLAETTRRLESEPSVAAISLAAFLPGGEEFDALELGDAGAPAADGNAGAGTAVPNGRPGYGVRRNRVTANHFDVFGIPILSGRGFTAGDTDEESTAVIVNSSFVGRILGDATPIGRRVRYARNQGSSATGSGQERWFEIVGVVPDFPAAPNGGRPGAPVVYHATVPARLQSAILAVRMRGTGAEALSRRLREFAADVDPNIQIQNVAVMAGIIRQEQGTMQLLAGSIAAFTLSVMLLSAAGIYAMMSFTVTQRRREIGIRAALGADGRRIVGSIFSRATLQLGGGALLGVAVAALMDTLGGGELWDRGAGVLPLLALVMIFVGACAAYVPARRSLAVNPIEALRDNR